MCVCAQEGALCTPGETPGTNTQILLPHQARHRYPPWSEKTAFTSKETRQPFSPADVSAEELVAGTGKLSAECH